jgi:hypothetical protein
MGVRLCLSTRQLGAYVSSAEFHIFSFTFTNKRRRHASHLELQCLVFPLPHSCDKMEGCSGISTVILCCYWCTFLSAEVTRKVGPSVYLKQKQITNYSVT